MSNRTIIVTLLVLASSLSWGQIISTSKPPHAASHGILDMHLGQYSAYADDTLLETIRSELTDEQLVRTLTLARGLSETDLSNFRLVRDVEQNWITLYQLRHDHHSMEVFTEALTTYARARENGHTQEMLLAGLTSRTHITSITNPAVRAIIELHPYVPPNQLKRLESGVRTNKAGEVASHVTTTISDGDGSVTTEVIHIPETDEECLWETYTLIDANICWRYFVLFKVDGIVDTVSFEKSDPIDLDPAYRPVLDEVDEIVTKQMKENGTFGHLGSVHTFWNLKQKELHKRGIHWHSPRELNPSTCYD